MFDDERWREIEYLEGFRISSYGRILDDQSLLVEPWIQNGNPYIRLSKGGSSFKGSVYLLVVQAFFRNFEGLDVEHFDGDPCNNYIDNLRFMYDDPNIRGTRSILTRKTDSDLKVLDKRIRSKVQVNETGDVFESVAACAYFLDIKASGISMCLNGKLDNYRGLSFRYI